MDYHVLNMKPSIFNAGVLDPVDVARRDCMEVYIEKIIAYRVNLKDKTKP